MKYLLFVWVALFSSVVHAQTYSGGLPLTINATNPSVGTNNTSAPNSSTQIGYRDNSGNLQPFTGSSGGLAITGTVTANQGTSPWLTSRSWTLNGLVDSVAVTGTVQSEGALNDLPSLSAANIAVTTTVTAPANTVEVMVQAPETNTANIRVAFGATATPTNGIQLQPGRSETFHINANASVCPESGTQGYIIQWASQ